MDNSIDFQATILYKGSMTLRFTRRLMKSGLPSDRILRLLFCVSALLLSFVLGTAVIRYQLPPSHTLSKGFMAVDQWYQLYTRSPEAVFAATATDMQVIEAARVRQWDETKAYNGYTLMSTGFLPTVFLLDMAGTIIHRWTPPHEELDRGCDLAGYNSRPFITQSHAYPNGDLLVLFGNWGAPYGCGIVKVDRHSNLLWSYKDLTHHDIHISENGTLYSLTHRPITEPLKIYPRLHYPLIDNHIIVLSPDGVLQKSISIMEALKDTPYELLMFHGKANGDSLEDWIHANSVDVLKKSMAAAFPQFRPGFILVSMRTMDALLVIDPATRKVVWAMQGVWHYQHAAHFLPNGRILLLDNRGHVEYDMRYSRVLEINPINGQVQWHYSGRIDAPFYTPYAGRLQRLPNGNTLVGDSLSSHLFEITPEGRIVWSYRYFRDPDKGSPQGMVNGLLGMHRYGVSDLPFLGNL